MRRVIRLGVEKNRKPLALSALLVLWLLVGSVSAATRVYVSVNGGGRVLRVEPKKIHLLSNENLFALKWKRWGGKTAHATGMHHGNFPSPGHRAYNPVQVGASNRRRCGSKLVYTALHLHFTRGVPYKGEPHSLKFSWGCPR